MQFIIWIAIGIIILVLLLAFLRWLSSLEVNQIKSGLGRIGLVLAIILTAFLLFTGKIQYIWLTLSAAIPWIVSHAGIFLRIFGIMRFLKAMRQGSFFGSNGFNWGGGGSGQHQSGKNNRRANNSDMTEEEAYSILGLTPPASNDEVIEAHKRLIKKLHPDTGGSEALARQINSARDRLLSK